VSATGEIGAGRRPLSEVLRQTGRNLAAWSAALLRRPRRAMLSYLPARNGLLAGLAMTALAVIAVMTLIDAQAFSLARGLPKGPVQVFNDITDAGKSGWFLGPLGVLLLVLALVSSPALGRITNLVLISIAARTGFLFLAIALPSLLASLVKNVIGRRRPSDLGPWFYAPFTWKPAFASMPSGHTTTAFAVAVAFGALFPRARWVLWIFAGLIALSRVVITAHFPSDVMGGALVGGLGALIVRNWFAAQRLAFALRPDGTVRPLPGPSWRRVKMVARRALGA
jgi:membrane-associated phospholipid phosphatase